VQLPQALLNSLTGIKGFHREAFEKVHSSGEQLTSIRLNPAKWVNLLPEFPFPKAKIPWTDYGYYLPSRPSFTFDPLFHAGCYYVQEASSMFLEQALKQTVDISKPLKILDLCAAPGGKSTHIQSLIADVSLLVSNELIRSRVNILRDNIIKWGCENVVVTNNDPKDFARLENYFDVIVVDAPCSGSGLFRRDPQAIEEWSEKNVQLCSQRQQRILADVLPALKKEGILIYSTCSYSKEENEEISRWLQTQFSICHVPCAIPAEWNIVKSDGGYRFWPDKVNGEGFYLACFRKTAASTTRKRQIKPAPELLKKNEREVMSNWAKTENKKFILRKNTVYAWPAALFQDFSFLSDRLNVVYCGVETGELMRDKLVPAHALAMSGMVADTVQRTGLNYENAIRYLQRKDVALPVRRPGWQLAMYEGLPLGWMNVLPNRINNYYPKSLRIVKEV
jgi:16S rRNA C967 or C1407 C5-methylase (RsmB/RsmF family)/NOL1/NOP2/fmu family ribosome biogenesis protein